MSTTNQPLAPAVGDRVDPTTVDRLRRLGGPTALAAGAALAIIGMALHVPGDGSAADVALMRTIDAQPTQWLISHLLLAVGMALVAVGAVAAFRIARGRGGAATAIGAGVMAVGGSLMSLGDLGHGVLAYALSGHVDPATSLEIQEAYFLNPAVVVLSFGGMLLPVGVVVVGIALLRSRAVPRWAAGVLIVSPILITVGFASGYRMLLLGIPFVVGLAVLARRIARS
jgi:hypothetical protein